MHNGRYTFIGSLEHTETEKLLKQIYRNKFLEPNLSGSQSESQIRIREGDTRYLLSDSGKTEFSYQNRQGTLHKYSYWASPESDKSSGEACDVVVGR